MIETFGSIALEAGQGDWNTVNLGMVAPAPHEDFWYAKVSPLGPLSDRTGLQAPAVYACVQVIAQTIASLSLNVHQSLSNGGKPIARNHPLQRVLHDSANEELTSFEFWETSTAHILTAGNSYSAIETDTKDNVTALHLLSPDRMSVERDRDTGVRFYRYSTDKGQRIYFDDELLHIPGLGYDGLKGYSPIELFARTINMALYAELYGESFFKQDAMPLKWVTYPHALSPAQREEISKWLKDQHRGVGNWNKPGVFEQGGKVEALQVNHNDIQFLELRKFQVEEIARIYRVPLHMIQSLDRATNNNIEHQSIDFAVHTIRPWCERIEARLNKCLFGPRESQRFFAEFNLDSLLRGDSESRAKLYSTLRTNGAITANQICARENYPPVPVEQGGDEYFIQGAMVPMRLAMQGIQGQVAPEPEPEEEEIPQ